MSIVAASPTRAGPDVSAWATGARGASGSGSGARENEAQPETASARAKRPDVETCRMAGVSV